VVEPRANAETYITQVPMYLEYWIDEITTKKSAPPIFNGSKPTFDESQNNYLKDLLRQLTVYTGIHFYVEDYKLTWCTPMDPDSVSLQIADESVYAINGYFAMYPPIMDFTVIDSKVYEILPGDGYQQLSGKDSITELFDKYYSLDKGKIPSVINSMALVSQAKSLSSRMKSVSFILLVSAIETLIDLERVLSGQEVERCSKCKTPKYKPTKNFIEFVKTYSKESGKEIKVFLSNVYDIRSKISHAGNLLLGDAVLDWDNFKTEQEHEILLMTLEMYVCKSIRAWLLSQ
jgi:hypothetical protein